MRIFWKNLALRPPTVAYIRPCSWDFSRGSAKSSPSGWLTAVKGVTFAAVAAVAVSNSVRARPSRRRRGRTSDFRQSKRKMQSKRAEQGICRICAIWLARTWGHSKEFTIEMHLSAVKIASSAEFCRIGGFCGVSRAKIGGV